MSNETGFIRLQSRKTALNQRSHEFSLATLAILLIAMLCFVPGAEASPEPPAPGTPTTMVIFHDHPLPNGLLPTIITTLRQQLASDSADEEIAQIIRTSSSASIQILSSDEITPGLAVHNPITVYLHGDCRLTVHPNEVFYGHPTVSGALGWVPRDHNVIHPFIHVDCNRLSEMLFTTAFGRNREQCIHLMAIAISRVILHEMIHIVTQSSHHSNHGLAQAQFTIRDLITPLSAKDQQPNSRNFL